MSSTVFARVLVVVALAAGAAPGAERQDMVGKPAPPFKLAATGETTLDSQTTRPGALVLVFYGEDASLGAYHLLGVCIERAKVFGEARATLAPIGVDDLTAHARLLEQRAMPFALAVDPHGELGKLFDFDSERRGWVVVAPDGKVLGLEAFPGDDPDAVRLGLDAALEVVRRAAPRDPPSFVAVMGEALAEIADLATLDDGRVAVLSGEDLILMAGDTNDVRHLTGEGAACLMVDGFGMLYLGKGAEVRRFVEPDGYELICEVEAGGGSIAAIAPRDAGSVIVLRGDAVAAIMPATLRTVPIEGVDGTRVLDVVRAPDNGLLVIGADKPGLRLIDGANQVRAIEPEPVFAGALRAAVIDETGRIFVALAGAKEILVFDLNGRRIASFPARGGGVTGVVRHLSLGAGYLDVAVIDDTTGKHRVLRFTR